MEIRGDAREFDYDRILLLEVGRPRRTSRTPGPHRTLSGAVVRTIPRLMIRPPAGSNASEAIHRPGLAGLRFA